MQPDKVLKAVKIAKDSAAYKLFKKPVLLKLGHVVTDRCNLRCSFCEVANKGQDDVGTERILETLDSAHRMGCTTYTVSGGEPLIREDLPDILAHASSKGMITKMVSNGTLLERRIDEVRNHLDVLVVSVDGPTNDIHDELRGQQGVFERTIDGIKAAISEGMEVNVNSVLTPELIPHLREHVEFLTDLGVSTITFGPITTYETYKHPREYPEMYEDIYGDLDVYRDALDEIEDLMSEYPISHSKLYMDSIRSLEYPDFKCLAGRLYCTILADGTLSPCYQAKKTNISIKDHDLEEAWDLLQDTLDRRGTCPGCFHHAYLESNAILNYDLNAIRSYARRYF